MYACHGAYGITPNLYQTEQNTRAKWTVTGKWYIKLSRKMLPFLCFNRLLKQWAHQPTFFLHNNILSHIIVCTWYQRVVVSEKDHFIFYHVVLSEIDDGDHHHYYHQQHNLDVIGTRKQLFFFFSWVQQMKNSFQSPSRQKLGRAHSMEHQSFRDKMYTFIFYLRIFLLHSILLRVVYYTADKAKWNGIHCTRQKKVRLVRVTSAVQLFVVRYAD